MKIPAINASVTPKAPRQTQAAAGLSLAAAIAAVLAATCCVLPIALAILGLGGAWLTFLGFFAANRPVILTIGLLLLALAAAMALHGYKKGRLGNGAVFILAATAILLGVALSAPLWERDATRVLWNVWTDR